MFDGRGYGEGYRTPRVRRRCAALNNARRMVVDESGDQCREFEEEALPHLDRVYRVALLLAGSVAMAEDLTQETMLKAFRAWHQYERGTNARGWLLTILRHTFINQNRKAHRAGTTIDIDKIEPYSVLHEVQRNDPEKRFFDRVVDEEVLRALDALPDEFHETLVLSDLQGLSYAAIAKITEVPVGTVKSRLFRARRGLRKVLSDYAYEMGYIEGRVEG